MKMRVLFILSLIAAAASAAGASQVRGTTPAGSPTDLVIQKFYVTTPPIPLEASARLATEIVHARVLDVRSEFPERGIASTVYTVQVLSAIKGSTAATMEVSVAGAVSESRRVAVDGAPTFSIGEELVLFLWKSPHGGETGILGLGRGAYRVSIEKNGLRRVDGEHAAHLALNEFLDAVGNAWLRAETKASQEERK